jgi:transcriptional regulator with XRE-family HTH domain
VPKLSGLMNERELAICARLRDLRSKMGASQKALARAIGTTRDQLASIEYGRNPLRYWLADRLCEKFDICQQWLARGEEPMRGYIGLPQEIGLEIAPRELFSAAYERRVGHIVRRRIQETESLKRSIGAQIGGADKLLQDRLNNLALCWFERIPAHLYDEYFGELMAASSDFFQRNRHRFSTGTWPPPVCGSVSAIELSAENENNLLTEAATDAKLSPVKSQLDNLLAALNRLTKESGKKTELAEFLGAPLASVSRWLSGEREPGGETTLKMLHWVEQQER